MADGRPRNDQGGYAKSRGLSTQLKHPRDLLKRSDGLAALRQARAARERSRQAR